MTQSVRQSFDDDLAKLKKRILTMGGLVEAMISDSVTALVQRDVDLARDVINRDPDVDRFEMKVDKLATRIIALRQPTASDLRLIIAALKISTDLERMGDLAVNISKRVEELNQEPQLKPYIDIPRMAEMAQSMVRGALDAFVNNDPEKAKEVLAADQDVDDLNEQLFRELLTFMIENPAVISQSMRLIFVAEHLERLADHATNVAEEVIFSSQGRDIRHGRFE